MNVPNTHPGGNGKTICIIGYLLSAEYVVEAALRYVNRRQKGHV